MGQEKRIPADIFEEMAGLKEITPPVSETSENSVNTEPIISPIDEARLQKASIAFFSKVKNKFIKKIRKFADKLMSYNKEDPIKKNTPPSNIEVTIIINESAAETEGRENAKEGKKNKSLIEKAWEALKFVVKKLFKFAVKTLVKGVIKTLLKIFKKMAKVVAKVIRKTVRVLFRIIKKITKAVFKAVKLIVKAIWRIVKKLFFRGKPSSKMFNGEPSNKNMEDPKIPNKKNHMKLKMKGIKKKENFIMKAFKKVVGKFFKVVGKIIKKIFKKIIKKIIKVVVKMIIKFIAAQVIGSLLPGIGNAIMGAASMALMVMDVLDIVNFVTDISRTVNDLNADAVPEPDEGDTDDEDEVDIDSMNMQEVQAFMRGLESKRQTSSDEYYEAKERYLELLGEQYAKEGDEEISELIQLAMETGRVHREADLGDVDIANNENAIKELNLQELQKEIERRLKLKAEKKYENKRSNIFDESELNTLLTGEEDGGPMWTSIWREFMWFIKLKIPTRLEVSQYELICREALSSHLVPHEYTYNSPELWLLETPEDRDRRVAEAENKILEEENSEYKDFGNDEMPKNSKFKDVIDIVDKYKFNTMNVTYGYRKEKVKEINAQRTKHNKLLKALTTILTTRNMSTEGLQHTEYRMSLEPTR
jgi:hypothetical protein